LLLLLAPLQPSSKTTPVVLYRCYGGKAIVVVVVQRRQ